MSDEVVKVQYNCAVKEVPDTDRTFRFIGSTSSVDRAGDVVEASGWELTRWRENPVILWNHGKDPGTPNLPIGKGVNVFTRDNELVFDIQFVPEKDYPFAGTVARLVKGGFIKAASVGFKPLEKEPIEVKDDDNSDMFFFPPTRYKKQELLELSLVPVPCNPGALGVTNSEDRMLMKAMGIELPWMEKAPPPFPPKGKKKKKKKPRPGEEPEEDEEEGEFPPKKKPRFPPEEDEEEESEFPPEEEEGEVDPEDDMPPGMGEEEETEDPKAILQALVFSKEVFANPEMAQEWALAEGHPAENVDETEMAFSIVIRPREEFKDESLMIEEKDLGVMAIVGELKVPEGMPPGPDLPKPPPGVPPGQPQLSYTMEVKSPDASSFYQYSVDTDANNGWNWKPIGKADFTTSYPVTVTGKDTNEELIKAVKEFTTCVRAFGKKLNEQQLKYDKSMKELISVVKSLSHLSEVVEEKAAPSPSGPKPVEELTEGVLKDLESSVKGISSWFETK